MMFEQIKLFLENLLFINYLFDSSVPGQLGFQDAATPIMESLVTLYNTISLYLIVIFFFVFWLIIRVVYHFGIIILEYDLNFKDKSKLSNNHLNFIIKYFNNNLKMLKYTHNHLIEIVWTIIPSILLICIAIPSFVLLYCMDEIVISSVTLKVIAHQWYWSYEYSDYLIQTFDAVNQFLLDNKKEEIHVSILNVIDEAIYSLFNTFPHIFLDLFTISFDSFLIAEDDLNIGDLRLLEVDNSIILPIKHNIRALVTSVDVLHSWCIPSLGVKIDAVPGRLNQVAFYIKREGTYYGQCSEICGVNHGYMPIVVEAITSNKYIQWISSYIFLKLQEFLSTFDVFFDKFSKIEN